MRPLPTAVDAVNKAKPDQRVPRFLPFRKTPAHCSGHLLREHEVAVPMLGTKFAVEHHGGIATFFMKALVICIGKHECAATPDKIPALLLVTPG